MTNTREKGVGRGSMLWPIAGQGIFAVVNFIASILFARITGPEIFGSYVFALTVVACLSVAVDLCVQSALLTAPSWDEDEAFIWSAFSVMVAAAASGAVLLIVALSLNHIDERFFGWLALAIAMPLQAATQVPRAHLILRQDQLILAIVDSVAAIGGAAIALAALRVDASLLALCLFTPVVALLRWILMIRFHPRPRRLHAEQWMSGLRGLRRAMRGFYLLQLSSFISRNLDNLVVGLILGARPLAFYSRGYGLFMGPLVQTQIALNPMSIALIRRDRDAFTRFGLRLSALVMPIIFLVLYRGSQIVTAFLGSGWDEVSRLLPAFMSATALLTFSQPCRWLLQSGRHHKRMNADAVLQLTLVLAAAVGSWFGDVHTAVVLVGFVAAPIVCASEWYLVWRMGIKKAFVILACFAIGVSAVAAAVEGAIYQVTPADTIGVLVSASGAIVVVLGALALAKRVDQTQHFFGDSACRRR